MNPSLREALLESGAVLNDSGTMASHFGDPRAELRAALTVCALLDRSRLGRVRGAGPDLPDLLHRLSTADLKNLQAGDGRQAVLTSPKGRIVERLFVHHLGEQGLLLVAGAGGAPRAIEHLDRFTFSEQTGLSDVGDQTCQLVLVGPRAADALAAAGFPAPPPLGSLRATIDGAEVWILGGDGLRERGFSLVAESGASGASWRRLSLAVTECGGRPAGEAAGEAQRVLRGAPASDGELNDRHNPLEAGLRQAISFDKGCYVGQEVIARLENYDKVSRKLVGLRLPAGSPLPPRGAELFADENAVGQVTSAVVPPGWPHPVGLAYVKSRAAGEALRIRGDGCEVEAVLVELPFPDDHAR